MHTTSLPSFLPQASALRLQQEVRSKETELEQAYSRLEAGEPPNEQAEREWEREVREERRRRVEAHTRRKVGTVRVYGSNEGMRWTFWGSNLCEPEQV